MLVYNQEVPTNELIVTLREKQLTDTDTFLLELINQTTSDIIYAIAVDESISPDRYQKLTLTASNNPDPEVSEVNFTLSGFYYYNIYENPSAILDPLGLHQVECGKLLVLSEQQSVPTYENEVSPVYVVYNPDPNEE